MKSTIEDLYFWELEEPLLLFGFGGKNNKPTHTLIRQGLADKGPYGARVRGKYHPERVVPALVVPESEVQRCLEFLSSFNQHFSNTLKTKNESTDFLGFEKIFYTKYQPPDTNRGISSISNHLLATALASSSKEQVFRNCVEVYKEAISNAVTQNDCSVVICYVPPEISEKYRAFRQKRRRPRGLVRTARGRQLYLWPEMEAEDEEAIYQDFRRALKAYAIQNNVAIQVLNQPTLDFGLEDEEGIGNIDKATIRWNLSLALYLKSGGVPWRLPPTDEEVCYVGVNFGIKEKVAGREIRVGLAQVFNTHGEVVALQDIQTDQEIVLSDAGYHLSQSLSKSLLIRALQAYEEQVGHLPDRVVVHKSSPFSDEEVRGMTSALTNVPWIDLLWLNFGSEYRIVPRAEYPPRRGTLCPLEKDKFLLYTLGFIPEFGTYPGHHVPTPIMVDRQYGTTDIRTLGEDILKLTKMNWNTTEHGGLAPSTMRYARRIIDIIKQLPPNERIPPEFKYYI